MITATRKVESIPSNDGGAVVSAVLPIGYSKIQSTYQKSA